MVLMESVVSGHQCTRIRERLGDKLELKMFDPYSKSNAIFLTKKPGQNHQNKLSLYS